MTYKEALNIVAYESDRVIHICEQNPDTDWHHVLITIVDKAKDLYEKAQRG